MLNGLEPINEDFRDVFSFYLGTSYDLNPTWTLNGGYFYYERTANKLNYNNAIPDGDRHGVSFGIQYNRKSYSIDLSYIAEFIPTTSIDNNVGNNAGAIVDGDYSGFVSIISLDLNYRF